MTSVFGCHIFIQIILIYNIYMKYYETWNILLEMVSLPSLITDLIF